MKVSVITVTYNALSSLKRTISSVLCQDYSDFEYIIVDGASSDGTRAFLESITTASLKWISEPDSGIYEAMNKGARMATGDYCIFMNAGDRFVNKGVLTAAAPFLNEADIILGNEILIDENDHMRGYTPAKGSFTIDRVFTTSVCHQATFIKRSVLIDHPYDENLRLVSDWKFILELFLEGGHRFTTIDLDICFFQSGGRTDTNKALGQMEKNAILQGYPQYRPIWSKKYRQKQFLRIYYHAVLILRRIQYRDYEKNRLRQPR